MESNHAIISPSSNYRMVPCPGSVKAQQHFPETEDTEESKNGTASHWVGSKVLQAYKSGSGEILHTAYIGRTAPNGVIITDEMAEGAESYIIEVLRVAQRCGGLKSLYIEERVDIPQIHASLSWGTPDAWIYDRVNGIVYIFDYKYGHRFVEVYENWQLISYTLGVLNLVLGDYTGLADQNIKVAMCLVQPRYFQSDTVRYWEVMASDLRAHTNILKMAAENALSDNPTIESGDHCRDCRARHSCEASQRAAMASIDIAQGITLVEYPAAALGVEIELLQRAFNAIKFRLTGLETHALTRIKKGESIPGLRATETYSRLSWGKSVQEIKMLGDLMGIDLAGKPTVITPTQAIKKGIDENVIKGYSDRTKTGLKLDINTGEFAKRIFGGI